MKDELMTHVSYEEATMLKERWEYDKPCKTYYRKGDMLLRHDNGSIDFNNFDLEQFAIFAPKKEEVVEFAVDAIKKQSQDCTLGVVVGMSEDTIVVDRPFKSIALVLGKCWIGYLRNGDWSTIYANGIQGNIIEGAETTFERKSAAGFLTFGDLVTTNGLFEMQMIADLFNTGILNASIKKVLDRYKITDYTLPEVQPLSLCPGLEDHDDLLDYIMY